MRGTSKLIAVLIALCWSLPVLSVTAAEVVRVNLNPLIDEAARSHEQFAVNVGHPVSSSTQGTWSRHGVTSTWVYSARIPSAVSMSFHASAIVLPKSAVLTVSTAQSTKEYVARDVNHRELWGRPMPGDTLNFSLSVDSSEASQVRFQMDGLQAGYRSLGGGVLDHPHYRLLKKLAAAPASCTENYACHVTPANQGPANATVALIISNLYECTGTLVNDTTADGTPYILTARHCQSGRLGGGNPNVAAAVSLYWDAVTACGSDLGSIYNTSTVYQTGATTVLEQQDIWLIRMNTPPAADDAVFAGWDASGAGFSGGYTIHHAQGQNKQYVEWNGTDLLEHIPGSTLDIGYDSTFLGVVNSLGNLGAGGSGSALFNPNNQVVGSASLAELISGENSAGVCPVSSPASPSAGTITALFTSLSGIWISTADRTSSTGTKTLQSILDPTGTGQMAAAGIATQRTALTASKSYANTGDTVTLSWDVQGAQSCTAWGGANADGWAGVQPAAGSVQVTSVLGGNVNYSLSCRTGNQIAAGTVAVEWNYVEPVTQLIGPSSGPMILGDTARFNWSANVSPCVATGGGVGDGWAGPQPTTGSVSLIVAQTGVTQYTLTCGTGARIATGVAYIDGVAPGTHIRSSVTQAAAGASFWLSWSGLGTGGACAASGGSGTDNWAINNGHVVANGSSLISESVPGTYTYTMTCTGGGQSDSSSTTVVVTPASATLSLTALAPEQQVGSSNLLNLLWSGPGNGCVIDYNSNSGLSQAIVLTGAGSSGAVGVTEGAPGLVTYTLRCQSLTATATINWVTTPTPSVLSVASSSWVANLAYPVAWNSSTGPCVASGGGSGDGWAGPKALSGTQSVTESQQGTYVFTLTCGSGAGATTSQVAVVVPQPVIQIYPTGGISYESAYQAGPINWQSTVGPCTYFDGSVPANGGVAVPPTGSSTPASTTPGVYLFSLECGSGADTLRAATFARVAAVVPTTLTANVTAIPVDGPVTLTWNSDGTYPCYASGGTGQAPWSGTLGGSGSLIVTSSDPGTITYGISCGNKTATAVVNYTSVTSTSAKAPTPTVTFSASATTQTQGETISLTWSAKNADSCSAAGGASGDGWTGTLAASGSVSVSESSPGTVTYSITCTGAPPAATATTTVVIKSAPTDSGAGGSHGGGGAMDLEFLLGLTLLLGVRVGGVSMQRRRCR